MTALVVRADARSLPLPDESVDLIVTSPPYWSLRDYRDGDGSLAGQIGAEPTPAEYVAALLECTREWMRVLKPSGSLWINLGDKYDSSSKGGPSSSPLLHAGPEKLLDHRGVRRPIFTRAKSMMLLPQRYAIGCVDQLSLILRAEVIWSKPSGMPESVQDRVRRAHEQFFHFTKQPRYFSAVDSIREPLADPNRVAGRNAFNARNSNHQRTSTGAYTGPGILGALPGSVWEVATQPLKVPEHLAVDHYATFPPALVRRIVLGWSPPGICTECGVGRRPALELGENSWARRKADGDPTSYGRSGTGSAAHLHRSLSDPEDRRAGGFGKPAERRITGYSCACPAPDAPARPALVVDPFGGTGTTALVASVYGRVGLSFDLSHDYGRLAQWRTQDPGERARALGVPKPPPVAHGQGDLFDGQVIA